MVCVYHVYHTISAIQEPKVQMDGPNTSQDHYQSTHADKLKKQIQML